LFPSFAYEAKTSAQIVEASALEMQIARDLEWLVANGSQYDLGPYKVTNALRQMVKQHSNLSDNKMTHLAAHIRLTLAEMVGPRKLARLGCKITNYYETDWARTILSPSNSHPFFRYSACLYAIGSSMLQLFELAKSVRRPVASAASVLEAKTAIVDFIGREHPNAIQVVHALGDMCRLVKAADPTWYKATIPHKKRIWTIRVAFPQEVIRKINEEIIDATHQLLATKPSELPRRVTLSRLTRRLIKLVPELSRTGLSSFTVYARVRSLIGSSDDANAGAETDESFAERRANWAVQYLPHGGYPTSFDTFVRRISLYHPCLRSPRAARIARLCWIRWQSKHGILISSKAA